MTRQGSQFVFSLDCPVIGDHWTIAVNGRVAETQPTEAAAEAWVRKFKESPEMQKQFLLSCDRVY